MSSFAVLSGLSLRLGAVIQKAAMSIPLTRADRAEMRAIAARLGDFADGLDEAEARAMILAKGEDQP